MSGQGYNMATTDYFRFAIDAILSAESDYSGPEWAIDGQNKRWPPYEVDTAETFGPMKVLAATSSGTTFEGLKNLFTASTAVFTVIKNLDASNYVEVVWLDLATTGSDATESARIPAGGFLVLPGLSPGTDVTLTANGAAVECMLFAVQD